MASTQPWQSDFPEGYYKVHIKWNVNSKQIILVKPPTNECGLRCLAEQPGISDYVMYYSSDDKRLHTASGIQALIKDLRKRDLMSALKEIDKLDDNMLPYKIRFILALEPLSWQPGIISLYRRMRSDIRGKEDQLAPMERLCSCGKYNPIFARDLAKPKATWALKLYNALTQSYYVSGFTDISAQVAIHCYLHYAVNSSLRYLGPGYSFPNECNIVFQLPMCIDNTPEHAAVINLYSFFGVAYRISGRMLPPTSTQLHSVMLSPHQLPASKSRISLALSFLRKILGVLPAVFSAKYLYVNSGDYLSGTPETKTVFDIVAKNMTHLGPAVNCCTAFLKNVKGGCQDLMKLPMNQKITYWNLEQTHTVLNPFKSNLTFYMGTYILAYVLPFFIKFILYTNMT